MFENINIIEALQYGAYALGVIFAFAAKYYNSNSKLKSLVAQYINIAEESFKGTSEKGQQKFEYALTMLYSKVPVYLRPFITQKMLSDMLQKAFDEMQDYAAKQFDYIVDKLPEPMPREGANERDY